MGKAKKAFLLSFSLLLIITAPKAVAQKPMTGDMIPEELSILKGERYSSIVIMLFMEKCVNSMVNVLLFNGFNPIFARQSAIQVCGCSMDQTRKDMNEDNYLRMFESRREMGQALVESTMKMCGELYGEYYSEQQKKQEQEQEQEIKL